MLGVHAGASRAAPDFRELFHIEHWHQHSEPGWGVRVGEYLVEKAFLGDGRAPDVSVVEEE